AAHPTRPRRLQAEPGRPARVLLVEPCPRVDSVRGRLRRRTPLAARRGPAARLVPPVRARQGLVAARLRRAWRLLAGGDACVPGLRRAARVRAPPRARSRRAAGAAD